MDNYIVEAIKGTKSNNIKKGNIYITNRETHQSFYITNEKGLIHNYPKWKFKILGPDCSVIRAIFGEE